MAQIKRTEARLRQIKQRQWVQKFVQHYVAATFSDAKEAPGIATGTTLRPTKLAGAFYGAKGIPVHWLEGLHMAGEIDRLAHALLELQPASQPLQSSSKDASQ